MIIIYNKQPISTYRTIKREWYVNQKLWDKKESRDVYKKFSIGSSSYELGRLRVIVAPAHLFLVFMALFLFYSIFFFWIKLLQAKKKMKI